MARIDPHSYADPKEGVIRYMDLLITVDFECRILFGNVTLHLDKPSHGVLHLDTRDISILAISSEKGPARGRLAEPELVLGSCLKLHLPVGSRRVSIQYTTSPNASALGWLDPEQTAGKQHPYLFTQCQAIHARSIVPCQDTPSVRFRYNAEIRVPKPLSVVIGAERLAARNTDDDPDEQNVYKFLMPQPIPSYLFAFAVGNIHAQEIGPRSRVYAEPEILDAAAWEFAEIEKMMQAAEEIFCPYRWDRYDMLVMPPSFPYGGMENARLSFFTPTIIVGDRSEIHVLPHELSHAWTGNLVTNATMDDFWLNEGLTMWGERRILERTMGEEYTILNCALGRQALEDEFRRFKDRPELTKLKTNLEGMDPDLVFSRIPYEKGFLFAALLEQTVGRKQFDIFMQAYMDRFAFSSITSEQFLKFLENHFPGIGGKVGAHEWVYEPGLPANAPTFRSKKLDELCQFSNGWTDGLRPGTDEQKHWGAVELQIFLQGLPGKLSFEECEWLDSCFGLTRHFNPEVRSNWFQKAAASGYEPAFPAMREFVGSIGRFKLIYRIWQELAGNKVSRERARAWYAECKEVYHPITRAIVEGYMKTAQS